MNASHNMKSGSSIKQQLASINMSERVRSAALHDACIAEMFVGAIEWVSSKLLQRSGGEVFAKPSPKY